MDTQNVYLKEVLELAIKNIETANNSTHMLDRYDSLVDAKMELEQAIHELKEAIELIDEENGGEELANELFDREEAETEFSREMD